MAEVPRYLLSQGGTSNGFGRNQLVEERLESLQIDRVPVPGLTPVNSQLVALPIDGVHPLPPGGVLPADLLGPEGCQVRCDDRLAVRRGVVGFRHAPLEALDRLLGLDLAVGAP